VVAVSSLMVGTLCKGEAPSSDEKHAEQ